MDQTTHAEPARIDELVAAYRDLQAQFDRARDRLRRADENRHTVQRRIYDRVRGEYDRELDAIRARMSPLRDEINRVHESLEAQCRDAESALQAVDDELAEAEFRHRTGEFEPTTYQGMRLSLDARAEEARTRQALLRATLDALEGMRRAEEPGSPAATASPARADVAQEPLATTDVAQEPVATTDVAPEPVAMATGPQNVPAPPAAADADTQVATAHAPSRFGGEPEFSAADLATDHESPVPNLDDILPRRPVLSAKRVSAPAHRPEGFENPHDWISEMAPDSARERPARGTESAVATAPETTPAVPIVAAELANATPPEKPSAERFPSLVFVSGPHAGQSIALLPTSLTIGREHDNNIEIKDPEVARYHARILRQKDHFVVEDLNSSTGTWVNGEKTQRAVLTHGDVIRLGQTELALDFEWTAAAD